MERESRELRDQREQPRLQRAQEVMLATTRKQEADKREQGEAPLLPKSSDGEQGAEVRPPRELPPTPPGPYPGLTVTREILVGGTPPWTVKTESSSEDDQMTTEQRRDARERPDLEKEETTADAEQRRREEQIAREIEERARLERQADEAEKEPTKEEKEAWLKEISQQHEQLQAAVDQETNVVPGQSKSMGATIEADAEITRVPPAEGEAEQDKGFKKKKTRRGQTRSRPGARDRKTWEMLDDDLKRYQEGDPMNSADDSRDAASAPSGPSAGGSV